MKTNLKRNEKIALITKSHWLLILWPYFLVVIGIISSILIGNYGYIIPIVLTCYLLYRIIQRNNNIWVVTNLRIIDEFGVFSLNSKESPLDKINNVTYSQTILGRIFGFGNVQIQTAAEIGSTTYYMVEKPEKLKDTITSMQEEYKNNQILSQAQHLAEVFPIDSQQKKENNIVAKLEKLFELKEKGILTEKEFNDGKIRILKE